ncbi:MAG TPA: type VI secretion system baseplate subunit TssG [Sphingomonas sp.]|uniref:type VI secretion system baseplate subunit TssG n=1 Tax=Sphingomonas sp. TaxID=28214 RepID=UPI002ED94FE8
MTTPETLPAPVAAPPAGATTTDAEFFQAVRLILDACRSARGPGHQLGDDTRAPDEPIRFHAADGMRHPVAEITDIARKHPDAAIDMTVAFMGLTGPSGVMPDHYSDLVVERRRARDEGFGQFLDLFNHRTLSLFYRAWAKYRLPVRFGEVDASGQPADPFARALAAIAGLSGAGGDPRLLPMAGALSRRVRSAGALRRVLTALYDLPIEILEMRPRWIRIDPDERSRLGSARPGAFSGLGTDGVIGTTALDLTGRFRVRIGPLDLPTFRSFFTPDGPRHQLTRTIALAVGGAVDFDLQLVLRGDAVPGLRLSDPARPAHLGQNSWLIATPGTIDREDATLPGHSPARAAI